MTDVNLKEAEQTALADQALARFRRARGTDLGNAASAQAAPRTMGGEGARGEEQDALSPEAPAWAAEICSC